jgi:UDP-glucose 4-epimerase
MVVPRFVQSALANQPIVVYDDGQQSRCFAHVLDVVEAFAVALDRSESFGQVINVGSNNEVTIDELAKRAIELTGSKSEIRHVPYSSVYGAGVEDMRRRVPSLAKAQRLLGYRPTRTLETIINDVATELRAKGSTSP